MLVPRCPGLVAALTLPLVLWGACAGPGADTSAARRALDGAAGPAPADPTDPDIARRPYSPEQIRDAMPVGSWSCYRIEQAGEATVLNTTSILQADDVHVTMSHHMSSESGEMLGQASEQEDTWRALQHHATFPLAATTITSVDIELPSGRWECWLYTVTEPTSSDGEETSRYHFAKNRPGAPVAYEHVVDGKRLFFMTLIGEGLGNAP